MKDWKDILRGLSFTEDGISYFKFKEGLLFGIIITNFLPNTVLASNNKVSRLNYYPQITEKKIDINYEKIKYLHKNGAISTQEASKFINESVKGYKTFIGERGLKISGGEKQRIGIARALYKSHEVLVLDESTSALDNETEDFLMDSLYKNNNDITFIIIAHKLRTLKKCDRIIKLKKGEINWVGTPKEFFKDL